MNKGNSKYLGYLVIFIILWTLISCGILKNDDSPDKPLTDAELMKKLHQEEKKQHKIAEKAAKKAKKEFQFFHAILKLKSYGKFLKK